MIEIAAWSTGGGKGNLLQACAFLLSVLGVTMSASCPVGVTTLTVATTAEALELSEALLCSGAGDFEVEWSGEVLVTKTISVSNSTSLTVTGSGSTMLPQAVIDGGGDVQLFVVDAGSSLELNSLSIQRGLAWPGSGGAVEVVDSSLLTVIDCSFSYNNASYFGGKEVLLFACFQHTYKDVSNNEIERGTNYLS